MALTINMLGTGIFTALIPLTLRSSAPVLWTWIALTISGMFQGSLIPAHQDMKRHWLPVGAGRAVANRIIGIGLTVNFILATSLTPVLATKWGWRSVFHIYAGVTLAFAGLWHCVATDGPAVAINPPAAAEEPAAGSGDQQVVPAKKEKVFEWRIFTVPAVLVAVGCKGTSGLPEYCLTQWLPTEFSERFGSSDTDIAFFRIWVTPLMFTTDWVVGFVEEALMARGVPELTIRRWFSSIGATLEAIALTGFALARTARQAALANAVTVAAYTLHHGGWSANLLEVGGKDTPVMNAFSNILNNAPGFFIPPLGLLIKNRTGSVLPLFAGCSLINWVMNLLFARYCSLEPARDILARRDKMRSSGDGPPPKYRPCVGVCLVNQQGEAFVAQRVKETDDSVWQMPQGGIDEGEEPSAAALRELYEETGVKSAEIVAELEEWLEYGIPNPPAYMRVKGWRGQAQRWFLLRLKDGGESEIDISGLGGEKREFRSWKWLPLDKCADAAWSPKRAVYTRVCDEFQRKLK